MRNANYITGLVVISLLSACQQQPGGGFSKQGIGTAAGAIGGGVVGSTMGSGAGKTAATIGGALLGGLFGGEVGRSLDNADMAAYNTTSQRALETVPPGETLPWRNPKTGSSGTVTPYTYYRRSSGEYCRQYSQSITIDGRTQKAYGTACREPDGAWRVVES